MENLTRDIQYLKQNLLTKPKLSNEELTNLILYDLYLKHLDKAEVPVQKMEISPLNLSTPEAEFNDIFPKLKAYEVAKTSHAKGISEVDLITPCREMLKELIEFHTSLYQNADTQEERALIKKAFGIISNIN